MGVKLMYSDLRCNDGLAGESCPQEPEGETRLFEVFRRSASHSPTSYSWDGINVYTAEEK